MGPEVMDVAWPELAAAAPIETTSKAVDTPIHQSRKHHAEVRSGEVAAKVRALETRRIKGLN